jgi:hypothetical protein
MVRWRVASGNVLAAVAVELLYGIAPDAIRRAVAQFRRRASTGAVAELDACAT